MKKQIILSLVLMLGCCTLSAAVKKSNLRVLYVGGSSDIETLGVQVDSAEVAASAKERAASFESYLKTYFKEVKAIDAKEYTPSLSDSYDVTIIDGTPKPLRPRKILYDEKGNYKGTIQALYFPQDFDRPVITIAEKGETLGRGIGLKTDWYCLCLDADAHHLVADHPIFKGPYKTKLTMTLKPTPEDAKHYAYFIDEPIPDSTLMWTVQKKGYIQNKGYRVGMVARPWGFADSPEAEYISSGVCAKTIDAVAIGRHANFLHWGFSASPADMTDEAKAVFANAVVYISKFAGHKPIARKYNDRRGTREYLKELKYLSTRVAWQERLQSDSVFYANMKQEQDELRAKKEKGETLTKREELYLGYQIPAPTTYEQFLKRYQKKFFEKFGTDENAYARYYDENRDYFYCPDDFYVIQVDEDVKSLGIANNDKRVLDAAIRMWENGQDVDKARRILRRYTLCRYETPQEWRSWYDTYQDKLFFTESGGWLWLVNAEDPATPGNDYTVWENEKAEAAREPEISGQTTDQNPVLVSAIVRGTLDEAKEVLIRVKIHPGYHIYGEVSDQDPFIPTEIQVVPSENWQTDGVLQLPAYAPLGQTGTTIYEGDIIFRQRLKGSGAGTVKVTVSWQCCDDHVCLQPQEKTFTLDIK